MDIGSMVCIFPRGCILAQAHSSAQPPCGDNGRAPAAATRHRSAYPLRTQARAARGAPATSQKCGALTARGSVAATIARTAEAASSAALGPGATCRATALSPSCSACSMPSSCSAQPMGPIDPSTISTSFLVLGKPPHSTSGGGARAMPRRSSSILSSAGTTCE
eukprot:6973656-Prymnesium_polylepis.1